MVLSCCVCKTKWKKTSSRSFHKFPKDSYRKQIWLGKLNISESDILVFKQALVCSDHFKKEHFQREGNRIILTVDAVPELNSSLSVPEEVKENVDMTNIDSSNTACLQSSLLVDSVASLSSSPSSATSTASSDVHNEDCENTEPPLTKKRRIHYPRVFGDIHSSDMSSPTRAKVSWKIAKSTVLRQKKHIRQLQQINRRLRMKITSLKSLLQYFKDNKYITESAESVIQATLPGSAAEIMKRVLKGPSHAKYCPELRSFALTLHFYSPKAYEFVREKFNKSLPHSKTISKWYQTIDGEPGFTVESLRAIKTKVEESPTQQIFVNLVFDEMHLMQKVEWVNGVGKGFINIGSKLKSDAIPEATQALVFMIVALNGHWKIPVGYFFIESLSGSEKANLVKECLIFLSESSIGVKSITFDGATNNFTMMKHLGINLETPNLFKPYFLHPVSNENVHVFLDPSHMLKLIRNFFGTNPNLKNSNNERIMWGYLQKLVELQENEGLLAATKLKRRHLQWVREKMRVKIAAQTLSRSVSDALIFLEKDLKLADFQGASATAEFILVFNNLFDIFNSRNLYSTYKYKRPISDRNKDFTFSYLNYAKNYILGLTEDNDLVTQCGRKTGFLGFLICVESINNLYTDLVLNTSSLRYISTYKISQDHIEIFFSAIRGRCGSNNNPTARVFESCYKKLLIHVEVKGSSLANAVALDGTSILNCASSITKNIDNEDLSQSTEYIKLSKELEDHDFFSASAYHLTDYVQDIVIYIAGFVVHTVRAKLNCKKCCLILEDSNPLSKSSLQRRKTFGKLKKASVFVITLCQIAERCIRVARFKDEQFLIKFSSVKIYLINSCLQNLPYDIFDIFGEHRFDCEPLNDHCLIVSKLILDKYLTVRIHHEISKLQKSDKRPRIRSMLTKTVLFKNQ